VPLTRFHSTREGFQLGEKSSYCNPTQDSPPGDLGLPLKEDVLDSAGRPKSLPWLSATRWRRCLLGTSNLLDAWVAGCPGGHRRSPFLLVGFRCNGFARRRPNGLPGLRLACPVETAGLVPGWGARRRAALGPRCLHSIYERLVSPRGRYWLRRVSVCSRSSRL